MLEGNACCHQGRMGIGSNQYCTKCSFSVQTSRLRLCNAWNWQNFAPSKWFWWLWDPKDRTTVKVGVIYTCFLSLMKCHYTTCRIQLKQCVHSSLIENKSWCVQTAREALKVQFWILLPAQGIGLARLSNWNGRWLLGETICFTCGSGKNCSGQDWKEAGHMHWEMWCFAVTTAFCAHCLLRF